MTPLSPGFNGTVLPPGMPGPPAPMLPMMPPPPILEPRVVELRPRHPSRTVSQRDRAIVQQACERKDACEEFESAWRAHYDHDTAFGVGDAQWEGQSAPTGQQRVQLTLNQYPKYYNSIVNNGREHAPGLTAQPIGGGADVETAQMIEGYLRHVEKMSSAEDAYGCGLWCATVGGKGFWRIVLEYEDWGDFRSFYQIPKIRRIQDPLSVYLDFAARCDPDYHTATWGFVIERLSKAWVQERYEIDHATYQSWMMQRGDWVSKDECLLADYYCKEQQPVLLIQLSPETIRYVPQLRETADEVEQQQQMELVSIVSRRLARVGTFPLQPGEEGALHDPSLRRRQSFVPIVWQYKLTGTAILESTLWPGQYVPIIPVLGEEVPVARTVDYRGIVRNAIGPQQMINYTGSRAMETVALAPKAPYVGPAGYMRGYETQWKHLGTTPQDAIEYNPVDIYGTPIPAGAVHRDVQEPAIQSLMLMHQASVQLFKDTIGIPDPELGIPSTGERTGIAIQRRQRQSSLGTAHFHLNLNRAVQFTGAQLVDLLPQVLVEPGRVLRIIGADDQERKVQLQPGIARPQTVSTPQQPLPPDISGLYDPSVGTYDIVINPGPSYRTQREEAQERILQTAQVVPQAVQLGADLLVENLDIPKAPELARRLKRSLPPGILDPQDGKTPEERSVILEQQVTQLTAQMQQAQQMLSQQQVYVEDTSRENAMLKLQLTNKQGELQLEEQQVAQKGQQEQAEMAGQHQVEMARLALEQSKLAAQREKEEAELAWERQKFYLELDLKRQELRQEASMAAPQAAATDDASEAQDV